MIILGFLLIIVAVAAAVILIIANTDSIDVSALGQTWTVPALWLVVAGLAAMALAVLGLVLVRQARPRIPQVRGAPEATMPAQATHDESRRVPHQGAHDQPATGAETTDSPTLPVSRNEPGGSS